MRVGAVIRGSSGARSDWPSRLVSPALGRPCSAVCTYARQISGANRPQRSPSAVRLRSPLRPAPKKRAAQRSLNVPTVPLGLTAAAELWVPGDGVLGDEGLVEAVPGVRGDDRVHPAVEAGGEEGGRAAVGRAGEADHRIVAGRPRLGHLGSFGGEVDELAGVGALVARIVEMDQPAGPAEAASGVGDDGVAGPGQGPADLGAVGLAAAEAVGQHDRRLGHPRRGRQQGDVQIHRLAIRFRSAGDLVRGLDHRLVVERGRRARGEPSAAEHERHRERHRSPQLVSPAAPHPTSLPRSTIRRRRGQHRRIAARIGVEHDQVGRYAVAQGVRSAEPAPRPPRAAADRVLRGHPLRQRRDLLTDQPVRQVAARVGAGVDRHPGLVRLGEHRPLAAGQVPHVRGVAGVALRSPAAA